MSRYEVQKLVILDALEVEDLWYNGEVTVQLPDGTEIKIMSETTYRNNY